MSQLLKDICKTWGVVRCLTMSYHLQTNLTEKVNQVLKRMIASYVREYHETWDQLVHEFRFTICATHQATPGLTPATLHIGHSLKGPLDQLLDQAPPLTSAKQALLDRLKDFSSG